MKLQRSTPSVTREITSKVFRKASAHCGQGLEHISKILPEVLADIFQHAAAQHSEPTSSAYHHVRWVA